MLRHVSDNVQTGISLRTGDGELALSDEAFHLTTGKFTGKMSEKRMRFWYNKRKSLGKVMKSNEK